MILIVYIYLLINLLNYPIITFGIKATRPDTGFGYLKYDSINDTVEKFIEKPNKKLALEYIKDGNYYWNSSIFLFYGENINILFNEYQIDTPENHKIYTP
jgi:hypothetical protein